MCVWPFSDVWLESPPPSPRKKTKQLSITRTPRDTKRTTRRHRTIVHRHYGSQPQYYSHGQAVYTLPTGQPQPVYYAAPPAGSPPAPQYYTYATAPASIAAPAPIATAPSKSANFHVYQPQTEKSAKAGATEGNVWIGRTKQQVEEDNMKIAKKAGAYNGRKVAPVVDDDSQLFWVCEPDGSQSLRSEFRYIKTVAGDWHKDPRFNSAYYFVLAKDEPEGK